MAGTTACGFYGVPLTPRSCDCDSVVCCEQVPAGATAAQVRVEPFNYTPMAVNSISSGSPHVRPIGRTCGEPDEIKKNTHPKISPLLQATLAQVRAEEQLRAAAAENARLKAQAQAALAREQELRAAAEENARLKAAAEEVHVASRSI